MSEEEFSEAYLRAGKEATRWHRIVDAQRKTLTWRRRQRAEHVRLLSEALRERDELREQIKKAQAIAARANDDMWLGVTAEDVICAITEALDGQR